MNISYHMIVNFNNIIQIHKPRPVFLFEVANQWNQTSRSWLRDLV